VRFLKELYFNKKIFIGAWAVVFLFVLGHFFVPFYYAAVIFLTILIITFLADFYLLFLTGGGVIASRNTPRRFSNGDLNEVKIIVENIFNFKISSKIIDEIPVQFQIRDFEINIEIEAGAVKDLSYNLKPLKRGEYKFGSINVYVSSVISFVERRFRFDSACTIPVYPSFIQMKKYEMLAMSDRLTESGIKKIRRIGHSTEFEQIKEYVAGDDYRTINWKATARKNHIMVNNYEDEKSQQIYSVIDMGRGMKMPFEGMSLLDYAINASLAISNIVLHKEDKAGVITFSNNIGTILPAKRESTQLKKILDILYRQETVFMESDYEMLTTAILSKLKHRSLIMLYTNFESMSSLKRQLPYFRRLAANHLLVIIFFENTELQLLLNEPAKTTEQIYHKTIGEKFSFEKKQIVKELRIYKIDSILTAPAQLSINTINKYLELKARGLI
jgi:uncharacterized protein (DUF58 family)